MAGGRRILIGVTADISLSLMRGLPQFLRDHGWEVHVVCSPGPLLDELGTEPGIVVHPLAMAREPSPLTDARSLARWVSVLRRVRPDVVVVGTPKAGLLGGLAARMTRVPVRIYQLRGLRLETTTGAKRRLLGALERLSMGSAHTVLAVSPSLRARALELGLTSPDRIRVLGAGSSNGVVIPASVPSATERAAMRAALGLAPTGAPVVGFVGRLTADKGLDVLAVARDILRSRGVDHRLLIVGGVDENASPEVLHGLRAAGSPPVETGHLSDARRTYAAMDLLCLPTLREGFPNVVLEAAAAGLPVVTTDATGAIDSVIDGETGRIARAGDPESLADALQQLIEATPTRRRELGAAGRARAEREFSRDHVWRLLEAFLLETVSGVPRP
jgi:glycosyltransferase involved in cell wall biosynthesis